MWVVSIAIYLISLPLFAGFISPGLLAWIIAASLVATSLWVFVFWVVALHLNLLILKLVWACGFVRTLPVRRGQGVLVVTATTVMALLLHLRGALGSEIAEI